MLSPTAPPVVTSGTVSMYQLWLDYQNSSSWALLHSQVKILKLPQHQDMSVILPLWWEDSKSPATVKHLLNVLIQMISYLNLGQTATVKLNQPLYVIAKRIQWLPPNEYSQNKFDLISSALHIEMVMLSCFGDVLENSGWTIALSKAGITTPGNDTLLIGHAVAKSNACTKSLHVLQCQRMVCAYAKCIESNSTNSPPSLRTGEQLWSSKTHSFTFGPYHWPWSWTTWFFCN